MATSLTAKQLAVLRNVVGGLTNNASAEALGVSVNTIKQHRKALNHKANASNTAGLIAWALRHYPTQLRRV